LAHEFNDRHVFQGEGDRAGVAARHFQEIFDERLEDGQVGGK
jgi:hypothetical protein